MKKNTRTNVPMISVIRFRTTSQIAGTVAKVANVGSRAVRYGKASGIPRLGGGPTTTHLAIGLRLGADHPC